MNVELAEKIANAVLYEGYILYPYRPSAVKNRQRWTFGGIYPQAYGQAQGETEPWQMRTECLVAGSPQTSLEVKVRFLHLQERIVGELEQPLDSFPENGEPAFRPSASLRVGDQVFHTWQESVEREVNLPMASLAGLMGQPQRVNFSFPGSRQVEPLPDGSGQVVGIIVRAQQALEGAVEVVVQPEVQTSQRLFKIAVQILNFTPLAERKTREEALLGAFVSTHTLLQVQAGEFVSLLDPPEQYHQSAAACQNVGTYPVLVGEEGQRDLLLSSPIILYDYPQIAPESAGDLFDGTEIDEILTLRILTMTDEEKEEARQADERARALLDRTEALTWEQMAKMHGTIRSIGPTGRDER